MQNKPIFVRGFSRSGGTLMVTLLDSHSAIAMSYEQYPNLLVSEDGNAYSKNRLLEHLLSADEKHPKGLRTFVIRALRGGLTPDEISDCVSSFEVSDPDVAMDEETRIKLIGEMAHVKMIREGKMMWGLKCSNAYSAYQGAFPKARFLNITRDGRDVAGSQMNTGSFNKSASEVAVGWRTTHRKFEEFAEENPESTLQIFYEELVTNSERVLRRICEFLELEWDEGMLNHSGKNLTIFKVNHLSSDRLRVPIDSSKIGRWRNELSESDLEEFMREAGDLLSELGYI